MPMLVVYTYVDNILVWAVVYYLWSGSGKT